MSEQQVGEDAAGQDAHSFQFGDFVGIEQKRYGVPNETYCYRVVSSDMNSTRYRPVPFDAADCSSVSGELAPVLLVVNASLTSPESRLHFVRPQDVVAWNTRATPKSSEGELLSELEKLRDRYKSQMKFCDIEPLPYFRDFASQLEVIISKVGKAKS